MTALDEGYIPKPPPPTPVPPIPNTPGERVRWLREHKLHLSIRDACEQTGVTRGDWDGIENGRKGPRFLENLRLISIGFADNGKPVNLAWLQCLDVAPPFPRSVTVSDNPVPKRPGKARTRRNSVYNSAPRVAVAA